VIVGYEQRKPWERGWDTRTQSRFMNKVLSQNKVTQKVDSSNRCHAMIHHQNADTMVLASARLGGIPLDVRHFEYYQGGVNAS
jgi:hypothetical protein